MNTDELLIHDEQTPSFGWLFHPSFIPFHSHLYIPQYKTPNIFELLFWLIFSENSIHISKKSFFLSILIEAYASKKSHHKRFWILFPLTTVNVGLKETFLPWFSLSGLLILSVLFFPLLLASNSFCGMQFLWKSIFALFYSTLFIIVSLSN